MYHACVVLMRIILKLFLNQNFGLTNIRFIFHFTSHGNQYACIYTINKIILVTIKNKV